MKKCIYRKIYANQNVYAQAHLGMCIHGGTQHPTTDQHPDLETKHLWGVRCSPKGIQVSLAFLVVMMHPD